MRHTLALSMLVLVACKAGTDADTDTDTDTDIVDTDTDVADTDTDVADTDTVDTDPMDTDTDADTDVLDTDTDTDTDTDLVASCVGGTLADNPYGCGSDYGIEWSCNIAPSLADWEAAVCALDATQPVDCAPGRVACQSTGGRDAVVVLAELGDVATYPVYEASSGNLVAVWVASDTNEFCGGRSFDAWFGDTSYRPCEAVMLPYDVDTDTPVCDTDIDCPQP